MKKSLYTRLVAKHVGRNEVLSGQESLATPPPVVSRLVAPVQPRVSCCNIFTEVARVCLREAREIRDGIIYRYT